MYIIYYYTCKIVVYSAEGGVSVSSANGYSREKAVLYARVSTEEQARSGYSLAQQLEALRAYATRKGYEVLEEVVDPGQRGASLERPGMDRVRDLVDAGGVSVVLAQDRDRLACKVVLNLALEEDLAQYGCRLQALNDYAGDGPKPRSCAVSRASSPSMRGRR
jgi:site-specific DNA recombinase